MIYLDFWFEWGTLSPFWRVGSRSASPSHIDLAELSLSRSARIECARLSHWYDTSLNWEYPPHPGPWTPDEAERFGEAASILLQVVRRDLGTGYEVRDRQTAGPETR